MRIPALVTLLLVACTPARPSAEDALRSAFPRRSAEILTHRVAAPIDSSAAPGDTRLAVKGADGATLRVREEAPGAHTFWTAIEGGHEEWLLTTVPGDGVAARWTIEGGTLVARNNGAFDVVDASGVAQLTIEAPASFVHDDEVVATSLSAQGQVLAVHVAAPGQLALIDPAWRQAATLNSQRRALAVTLLQNGKVLAVGGSTSPTTKTNTAETFDPATGKWTPTVNSMTFSRTGLNAIALKNGLVLIAGDSLYSELYDPLTNSFDAGSLAAQAQVHGYGVLTLLSDGKVLMTGGLAELYDPATNTWGDAGQPLEPHGYHVAVPVGPLDGQYKVLIVNGWGIDAGVTRSAELYNPVDDAWTHRGEVPGISYSLAYGNAGGRFPDGRVIITADSVAATWSEAAGWTRLGNFSNATGVGGTGITLPSGEFMQTGGQIYFGNFPFTFEQVPSGYAVRPDGGLSSGGLYSTVIWRGQQSVTLLPNGRALMVGGEALATPALATSEEYDISSLTLSAGPDLSQAVGGQVAVPLPSGALLLVGGATGGQTPSTQAQIVTGVTSAATAPLAAPRLGHTGTLLTDGRVLVVGGVSSGGVSTASVELFDPATGQWTAGAPMTTARAWHTATMLGDGTLVVAGGLANDGGVLKSAERLAWLDGGWNWTAAGAFSGSARANHVAALLGNGRVLMTGGQVGGAPLSGTETYDPNTNTWNNLGQPLNAGVGVFDSTATSLPSGGVLVVGGRRDSATPIDVALASVYELSGPTTGAWRVLAAAPRARSRHSTVILPNGLVLVAGGVQDMSGAVQPVDVYDPEFNTWSTPVSTATGHERGTVTVLSNGQVQIAGGLLPLAPNSVRTELIDEVRGAVPGSVPTLAPIVATALPGGTVSVTGTGFMGQHMGPSGSRGNAPTNFPVVSLDRIGTGQRVYALSTGWTGTSTQAVLPAQMPLGWYQVRVSVNGVTSGSTPLLVGTMPTVDAGVDAGAPDGGGGMADAGAGDGGTTDAGGTVDAGTFDAGTFDAGTVDAGTVDAGTVDAGTVDAGTVDAGQPDASVASDAGTPTDGGASENDGGVTPSPGLYGCLCGASGASGSSLVSMGMLLMLFAVRRRRSAGMVVVALLTLAPLAVRAEAPKAKAGKAKTADPKKKTEAPPAVEPAKVEAPAPASAPAPVVVAPPPEEKPAARARKGNGKIRVAVLPLTCGPGVQKELAEVITDAIASALANHKELEVTSSKDVMARLGFERQRQLLGGSECGDNLQCMVEIGNALGVDKIAFGSVARLGTSAVLSTTVIELEGSEVVRHTERVKNVSEEAFLDAIPPTIEALFPRPEVAPPVGDGKPVVSATGGNSELDGTHVALTVRGQMAPLNLPLGAVVVHVDYSFSETFSAGLGAIIAKPFGIMARGTFIPFNASGVVRPLVSLEVPVFFSATSPSVGIGGALGVEFRIFRQLAVGLEVPLSYYVVAPPDTQRFWLFGAVTLTGRL